MNRNEPHDSASRFKFQLTMGLTPTTRRPDTSEDEFLAESLRKEDMAINFDDLRVGPNEWL